MSQAFLGEIRPFAFDFPPRGWALCNGQILAINQNTDLFSLLGTTYGGNGTTTYALPNLQGRAPISAGQRPGLSNYNLGEVGGVPTVTLTVSQLAAHTHLPQASSGAGNQRDPFPIPPAAGYRWAGSDHPQYSAIGSDTAMAPGIVGAVGGGQGHQNESPYLTLSFCIALTGVFPSRN